MDNKQIDQLLNLASDGHLGHLLRYLRPLLSETGYHVFSERLNTITVNYEMMLDYMSRGFNDTQRDSLYQQLLRQTRLLVADVRLHWLAENRPSWADALRQVRNTSVDQEFIRSMLQDHVTSLAMLQFEGDEAARREKMRRQHQVHRQFVDRLFLQLWLAPQWQEGDAAFYGELLSDSTIDSTDAQQLVSAVTLSVLHSFDVAKFHVLIHVWKQSADEPVRQRALVGLALAAARADRWQVDEVRELTAELCADEPTLRAFTELQLQLYLCKNAEADTLAIQRDIMPSLMKNSPLNITRFGITEKEDDSLQDILDPGAADRAMEEMEAGIQRMVDMQKSGADIYFGGFSQMKRFSFFYSVPAWFCPFSMEHPALQQTLDKLGSTSFLENLLSVGPFCDSDKYSFALAMANVIDRIPANLRELMGQREALGPLPSEHERSSAAYVRRMYLQDLYRFFRVYTRKQDFDDPFGAPEDQLAPLFFASDLFRGMSVDEVRLDLCQFFLKHSLYEALGCLLETCHSREHPRYLLLAGIHAQHEQTGQATRLFTQLLTLEPENVTALSGLAREHFLSGRFADAARCYARLLKLKPSSKTYALNHAVALIKDGKAAMTLNELYRLNLEYPNDENVSRVLAWALLACDKISQAEAEYEKLLAARRPANEDWLNAGYCAWIAGNVGRAIMLFKHYRELVRESSTDEDAPCFLTQLEEDHALLEAHGITRADLLLMDDLS